MATILRLDPTRCDAYGMCAELLPELVSLDEWGYPVIRPGAIPDQLLDHARRAVDVCPVLALRLQGPATASRRRGSGPEPLPASVASARVARAEAAWTAAARHIDDAQSRLDAPSRLAVPAPANRAPSPADGSSRADT
jgi:ferredoxin